jgi:L-aspartate oxidase
VYLDVTHLGAEKITGHFPNIYETCLTAGVDMTKEWIPIVPAAHYACGGVDVDLDGRTSVENLYACGEVSCTGVHGANRLASNSLLEAIVFARRAIVSARKRIGGIKLGEVTEYPVERHTEPVTSEEIERLILELRTIMWKYVGIVRTSERLDKAFGLVAQIKLRADELYANGKLSARLLELRNMAIAAELIIMSAQARKESRGLHYNLDFPFTDDAHCKHDTLIVQDPERSEPVILSKNSR